jgi:hypothetical protein
MFIIVEICCSIRALARKFCVYKISYFLIKVTVDAFVLFSDPRLRTSLICTRHSYNRSRSICGNPGIFSARWIDKVAVRGSVVNSGVW